MHKWMKQDVRWIFVDVERVFLNVDTWVGKNDTKILGITVH